MKILSYKNTYFTENEKAVIRALASFKFAKNVSVVARKSGLPRTTALYILRRLEKSHLARHLIGLDGRHRCEGRQMVWLLVRYKPSVRAFAKTKPKILLQE